MRLIDGDDFDRIIVLDLPDIADGAWRCRHPVNEFFFAGYFVRGLSHSRIHQSIPGLAKLVWEQVEPFLAYRAMGGMVIGENEDLDGSAV